MSLRAEAVAFAVLTLLGAAAGASSAQEPKRVERYVVAGVARVEQIDKFARSLTVRTDQGLLHTVYVGPELTAFDGLNKGDMVKVRVVDSVVVAVRRDARPTVVQDTTTAARQAAAGSPVEVLQQLKVVATIDNVDVAKRTIVYRTAENRSVMRMDVEPALLEGLKKGDIVELTYTRERAVELEKQR